MRLILIRHGESEGNAAGVFQGRVEYGLTARGRLQAEAAAARLAAMGIDRLFSSPQRRALETAGIVSALAGPAPGVLPELAEYDIGAPSGLTPAEIRARFPGVLEAQRRGEPVRFPGEEGREAFAARVRSALERLTRLEGTTVAVTHGGVVAAVCHLVLGADLHRRGTFRVGNCSFTEVVRDGRGRLVIARHNDTCHLDGLATFADRG